MSARSRDDGLDDLFQGFAMRPVRSRSGDQDSDYYPGSKVKRKAVTRSQAITRKTQGWDEDPVVLKLRGVDTEFFTVAHLGAALNRKPRTMRKWEEDGHIPKAEWRTPGDTIHAQRRLYSREQVEGILAIAVQEHLMDPRPPKISKTHFALLVRELFAELRRT